MIAERLKKQREKKGLNQTQAAEKLKISRVNYNRYENGEREPDNDTLKSIANFFGVTTDYLLGRTDNPGVMLMPSKELNGTITKDNNNPDIANLLRDNGIQKLELVKDVSLEELKIGIELIKTIRKEKMGG